MQLIVQDKNGIPVSSYSDFSLDLQYGDDKCDFVLYIPDTLLDAGCRILVDGTSFAGIIDRRCPSTSASEGDSITYEGRTVQGVLAAKVIEPPAGSSHLVVGGDAHQILKDLIVRIDLDDYLDVSETLSGISLSSYQFNRYVDAYTGIRMMLASVGARLAIQCHDGKHTLSAVGRYTYGEASSETAYFDLKMDELPVNHLIGLGKGEGVDRAVVHWYADILGNVSQTQTLFGVNENELAYNLNSEEYDELVSKTKSKLEEYQVASDATLTLPPGTNLDIGDRVHLSNSKFGITAEAEVVEVVLKASLGVADISYKFGTPDYPKDDE